MSVECSRDTLGTILEGERETAGGEERLVKEFGSMLTMADL